MGNHTTTTYDADGEVIQVTDPLGRITTTTYANRGWVATVTDPLGNVATYIAYTATGKKRPRPDIKAGSEWRSLTHTTPTTR